MKKHTSVLLVFGLLYLLFVTPSCLDEINFDRPETIENGLAIQGKLVKGNPSFIRVTIRKVFDFSDNARLINAKAVTLFEEGGGMIELDSRQEGVFLEEIPADHPNIQIDYGKSYKIVVETFDNRVYESSFEALYQVPEPTNLSVNKIIKEGVDGFGAIVDREFLAFTVDTPLKVSGADSNSRLLWELESTYKITDTPESYGRFTCWPIRITDNTVNKTCYITSSPNRNFVPLDGLTVNAGEIQDYSIFETSITSLQAEGYYLTVFQQSMSPTAFDYWTQVNQVLSRSGDLFEPPAGKVKTNFVNVNNPKDDVFGYFYATEEKPLRVYVSPELAGSPSRVCPETPSENGRVGNQCCDCRTIGASTVERPDWWIE